MAVKPQRRKHGAHHGTIPTWALRPSRVPLALLRAIYVASKKYNVPPDVLAGIWREESGSTYPNPAKNSSGYGGLFGTSDAYGTTQAQADLAASILHNGLLQSHGNVAEALSYYNSGKLQGGYTHVPGQVTTGTIAGYGGKPSAHGSSTIDQIGNIATDVGSAALNPVGTAESLVGKGASAAAGAIEKPIASELDKIGHWIMYGAAIFGGGITFIIGVVLIAADVGLSTKAGKVVAAVPAGRYIAKGARVRSATRPGGKPATRTSEPKSNIPSRSEERKEEMHQAQLKKVKAQTRATKSQAKNRKRTVKEQKAAEQKSYYKGATDAASPTMAKIRRERKKRK